jgi:twitching motility two-component system response regulator PilH
MRPTVTSPKTKVVVVDDSPTALQFAADALSHGGFEIQTASDGDEAIEIIRNTPPDVVVLDIILPKKNGLQVCRELKTNPNTQDVKVVLLSSKNQELDRLWGQRQGADAYVTKPIAPEELTAIVAAVAAGPSTTENTLRGVS